VSAAAAAAAAAGRADAGQRSSDKRSQDTRFELLRSRFHSDNWRVENEEGARTKARKAAKIKGLFKWPSRKMRTEARETSLDHGMILR
jgi:hypothetical protein